MQIKKTPVELIIEGRKKLLLKLEELLGDDKRLKLYHKRLGDEYINVISKNKALLAIADEQFKEIFDRVDYERAYNAKAERYKADFQSAYNYCKAAVKSNGNVSLNAALIGAIGASYDPDRTSTGYWIYTDFDFKLEELIDLDNIYFKELNDKNEKNITINDLTRLVYGLSDKSSTTKPHGEETENEGDDEDPIDDAEQIYSRNKILFGPPGTGKSYNIKTKMNVINVKDKNITRITFHPEYSYYEFVGQYKPVVAYEKIVGEIRYPNSSTLTNEKAFVYYDFSPGPFIKAIINALKLREAANKNAAENTLLIIEEINRGNSSAIFGDIFQLLDRINDVNSEYYGESEYSVDISMEMKEYIKTKLGWDEVGWNTNFPRGFIIPSNLYIYATMNTSDQSLYPMDSAFKRRWDMEYMYINYKEENLLDLYLPEPYKTVRWLDFIKKINEKIVNYTQIDDKQIGQWFVGNNITESEFLGKVISYLWFDIFRYDPQVLFKENIKTFDDVRVFYDKGIFKKEIIDAISVEGTEDRVSLNGKS